MVNRIGLIDEKWVGQWSASAVNSSFYFRALMLCV